MKALIAAWRRWRFNGFPPHRFQAVPMTALDANGWHAYRADGRYTTRSGVTSRRG